MSFLHAFKPRVESSGIDYVDIQHDQGDRFNVQRGEIMFYAALNMYAALNGKDISLSGIVQHLNTGLMMKAWMDREGIARDAQESPEEETPEHFAA